MQQFTGRPAIRERKTEEARKLPVSMEDHETFRERRLSGEPAKVNTRSTHRRIIWENDLYERQGL